MNKGLLLVTKGFRVLVTANISILFAPVFWIGCKIYGRPPNVVHLNQVILYLRYVWTADPSDPSLLAGDRLWLALCVLQKLFESPMCGTAWLVDEVLYGKQLDNNVKIEKPCFVISGGRSGSTQITRYLEADPHLVAPNILMCMFPYCWLWKLAPITIGRFVSKDRVRRMIHDIMPKESVERHELDPFQADTFDAAFLSAHLNGTSLYLGPTIGAVELSMAEFAPHNRSLVKQDYVQFIDRIARKTMLYNNLQESKSNSRRFLLKGHFLLAAPALAKAYPDCTILTVVRDPLQRLQSAINYLRVNPPDPYLGPIPWTWLTKTLLETEARYCEIEQSFFTTTTNDNPCSNDERIQSQQQPQKCVVCFQDFVKDLPGTMAKIYRDCMELDQVPNHIPRQHGPRDRTNYSVNKSLEELGVNQEALQKRLASYILWIESSSESKAKEE